MQLTVSLTTIASRLDLCRQVCSSLVDQARKPDRIIVNVSSEPYLLDDGIADSRLEWAAQYPLVEIAWVENTGPYRKLLPAMDLCAADDLIVTADDDVVYGPHWLHEIVSAAEIHPDRVICGRARRPTRVPMGPIRGYWAWPYAEPGTTMIGLVPVGIAGVAYRPRLLDERWLRDPAFKRIAPTTDDLWFAEAIRRKRTPVMVAPQVAAQVHPLTHPTTLFEINGGGRDAWPSRYSRLKRLLKSHAGIPCCANDANFRAIRAYSDTLPP